MVMNHLVVLLRSQPSAFLQVQDYFLWCSQLIGAMAAEECISDVATADLQLAQHQQLWAEMEARQETYQQAVDIGEELQTQDSSNRKEVRRTRRGFLPVWCRSCIRVFARRSSRYWRSCMRCRQREENWSISGTRNKAG